MHRITCGTSLGVRSLLFLLLLLGFHAAQRASPTAWHGAQGARAHPGRVVKMLRHADARTLDGDRRIHLGVVNSGRHIAMAILRHAGARILDDRRTHLVRHKLDEEGGQRLIRVGNSGRHIAMAILRRADARIRDGDRRIYLVMDKHDEGVGQRLSSAGTRGDSRRICLDR